MEEKTLDMLYPNSYATERTVDFVVDRNGDIQTVYIIKD